MLYPKNYLPYMGIERDGIRTLTSPDGSTHHFRIFTYQAYNALGLIGSEKNGICIANEDKKFIICDEIGRESSGWLGASSFQLKTWNNLLNCPDSEFIELISSHPRLRNPSWLYGGV